MIDCKICGKDHCTYMDQYAGSGLLRYKPRVELDETLIHHGILILSEEDAVNLMEPPTCQQVSCLRISDPGYRLPELHGGFYNHVGEFKFFDIERDSYSRKAMTSEIAGRLVEFFKQIGDDFLVIHCFAGISRSSAVGMAFARFKQDDELFETIRHSCWFDPNLHVYNLLSETIPSL